MLQIRFFAYQSNSKSCHNIRLVLIGIRDGCKNTDKSLSEINKYKTFL